MQGRPFALIGVNSDSLTKANRAVRANQLNWRSFQDKPEGSERAISAAWSIDGWPTLIVLDEDRRIRYWGHDGHAATRTAEQMVERLPAKKPRR